MVLTADQIAQLRRMVAEPTDTTYSDAALDAYAERYPIADANGIEKDDPAVPLSGIVFQWNPTYDLNAAAADVWQEKAAAVYACFDYSGDGNQMTRSQVFDHCSRMSRQYKSRRKARSVRLEGMSMTAQLRLSQKDIFANDLP